MKTIVGITGICAFVPIQKEGDAEPRAITVLFVDGEEPPVSPQMPTLRMVLRCRKSDYLPGANPVAFDDLAQTSLDGLDALFDLPAGVISLEPTRPRPAPLSFSLTPHPDLDPLEANRGDLCWLADLEAIKPGSGTPQAGWFTSPPNPAASIRGRLPLDLGQLRVSEFLRSRPGSDRRPVDIIQFASGHQQALATFSELHFECDQLTVKVSDWAGVPIRVLNFSNQTELRVEFWNTPQMDLDEVWQREVGPDPMPAGSSFLHYYRLSGAANMPANPTGYGARGLSTINSRNDFDTLKPEKSVTCVDGKTRTYRLGANGAVLLSGERGADTSGRIDLAGKAWPTGAPLWSRPLKELQKLGQPYLLERLSPGLETAYAVRVATKLVGAIAHPDKKSGYLVAFSALCTHLSCPLVRGESPDEHVIVHRKGEPGKEKLSAGPCPCHGSAFDLAKGGLVVQGPATQPLRQLRLEIVKEHGQDILASRGILNP